MVQRALNAIFPRILGESVILMSDSPTVLANLEKQGGSVSGVMCGLAKDIVA